LIRRKTGRDMPPKAAHQARNERQSHLDCIIRCPVPFDMLLNDLPDGAHATVARLAAPDADADATMLRRLADIGFIAGEPVQVLRRGPGGREPLAVRVGDTLFALRLAEARCVEVTAGRAP
jgi:ferrous iron transport protein A